MDPEQFRHFLVNVMMHQRRAELSKEETNLGTHYPPPPLKSQGDTRGHGITHDEGSSAVVNHLMKMYGLNQQQANAISEGVLSGSFKSSPMSMSAHSGLPPSDQLRDDAFRTQTGSDSAYVQENLSRGRPVMKFGPTYSRGQE